MDSDIQNRARFDIVRYANVWEDADVLCQALRPTEGAHFLSIASSGDNCFALLAEGAKVTAVDLSAAQLACTALKAAAIRRLEHLPLLRFLGINGDPEETRLKTYAQLRLDLRDPERDFWDQRGDDVRNGIIHCGKFERYFHTFRRYVLPCIHNRRTISELFVPRSADERRRFFDSCWDTFRWRLLFRMFFSRFVIGRLGRDPEFFRFVDGPVSERLRERTEYAFTVLDPCKNPYLKYILDGNFAIGELSEKDLSDNSAAARSLPRFLRPEVLPKVRLGLERLHTVQGTIEEAALNSKEVFDGFNLSDLFEYLDKAACARIYEKLLSSARTGARLAYWNMLVPRGCPPSLKGRVNKLDAEAEALFGRDLAFFYSAFVIEEVR